MAFVTLSLPPFPTVPDVLGVPPVTRAFGAVNDTIAQASGIVNSVTGAIQNTVGAISDTFNNTIEVLSSDSPLSFSGGADVAQWGLFDEDGQSVIVSDSVFSVELRAGALISDYPIEEGSFSSYNKVQEPFDAKLTFTSSTIDQFIDSVKQAQMSLDLYTVVMPDIFYENANVIHYDFRRDSRGGITMLSVDVWVREVRQSASAQFSSTQGQPGSGTGDGATKPTQPDPTGDDAADQAEEEQANSQTYPPANVGTAQASNGGTVQAQPIALTGGFGASGGIGSLPSHIAASALAAVQEANPADTDLIQ